MVTLGTPFTGHPKANHAWRIYELASGHSSVEVHASHRGIGVNAAAWYALPDRLAQAEDSWRHFHREGWRRWLYRDPYRADG